MHVLYIRKIYSAGEAVRTQVLSHLTGANTKLYNCFGEILAILKTAKAINNSYRNLCHRYIFNNTNIYTHKVIHCSLVCSWKTLNLNAHTHTIVK